LLSVVTMASRGQGATQLEAAEAAGVTGATTGERFSRS
jgi:hypothetical protein